MAQELILNFHGIGEPDKKIAPEEAFFWVTPRAFTNLLDAIAVAHEASSISTVITFDDGNVTDLNIAMPELVKRGLRAIFFVCAGRTNNAAYLNKADLRELLAAGMEIGSHGMDHRNWRGLDKAALNFELTEARRLLEDAVGGPVKKAAIPFGSYDRKILRRLRREGFEAVYTSDTGKARADSWLKPRETVDCTWGAKKIGEVLTTEPSAVRLLRRNAAMLYKRIR